MAAIPERMKSAPPAQYKLATATVIAVAVLFRLAVGAGSYSGAGRPPMNGDYEAQRHWMEVTMHTPIRDWYRDTKMNDLSYWGLDYPPLTAYQSWLYGRVIAVFEPAAVALGTSRGYETASSKALMRWSVILTDLLVLVPAILACAHVFGPGRQPPEKLLILAAALLQPAAVLIDHGHFQYNSLSLGLTAGAAAAVGCSRHVLGSTLYCLALNHKQMAAYYAPAFLAHLLGCCLHQRTGSAKLALLVKLAITVLACFAVVWAPFLGDPGQVLGRLVPLKRGLFEDYVANWWCASSLLVKWKRLLSLQAQVRLCTVCTLAACLPSMAHQILRPSPTGLLLGMANSALAFFIFSFQVHEKSVLLPLLPLTLLAAHETELALWLPAVATFSMWPLLSKDGLAPAYVACLLLWAAFALLIHSQRRKQHEHATGGDQQSPSGQEGSHAGLSSGRHAGDQRTVCRQIFRWGVGVSVGVAAVVHAAQVAVQPPKRLLFLYDALITVLGFVHLAAAALWLNWRQWSSLGANRAKKA